MRTMIVLCHEGDKPFEITDEASEKVAREMFDKLVNGRGFTALNQDTMPMKRVKEFDEAGEKPILFPQLQGG